MPNQAQLAGVLIHEKSMRGQASPGYLECPVRVDCLSVGRDYILVEEQKGGRAMRTSMFVIMGLMVVLLLPQAVLSDCLTFGRSGPVNWYVQNDRTIIFYDVWGSAPIAQVTLRTCKVNEDSVILLSQRYLCDTDKIIVDNQPCSILTITSASGPAY